MTVEELIKHLEQYPKDATVECNMMIEECMEEENIEYYPNNNKVIL